MNRKMQSNQRQLEILQSLDKLEFLTTSQLLKLHKLSSIRNTNRIMNHQLKPYTNSFKDTEMVYYLNTKGRELIGSTNVVKRSLQATHKIMRNEMYIFLRQPKEWVVEHGYEFDGKWIRPDAEFKRGSFKVWIEIDHLQSMKENEKKVKRFKELRDTGLMQRNYYSFPKIIWLTTTEYRRKKLNELCKDLDVEVYTVEDIK
jgi:hypothetical protein